MKEHTSQGLSQRLHDKGFRGEHKGIYTMDDGNFYMPAMPLENYGAYIPAYTFTELWGVLPFEAEIGGHRCRLIIELAKDGSCFPSYGIVDSLSNLMSKEVSHESPAEAVGLLLEWLIDNGHVVKGE